MKKLFCLLIVIVCSFALWSCTMLPIMNQTCTVHIDNNGDLLCDVCGTAVECTQHRDANEDLKCDKCQADVTCTHKDDDNDGKCDIEACDHVFCEHEYDEEYSYNKSYHYFEPTCGCDIDPKDKEKHADKNNDGICDGCEWNYNHKHTYATDWSHDAKNHWYAATCDHTVEGKSLAPHTDADNDGICDGCLWNYDHEHTYGTEWSSDDKNHWHAVTCTHDLDDKDLAAHVDANNDGTCDVCEWNGGHEHTYNEERWNFDEESHWHAPTCGHTVEGKDIAKHVDEEDGGDGLCDVCEYIVCDNHEIDYSADWGMDATTHWRPSKCGHASAYMEAAGHTFDPKDGILCTTCGYNSGHEHVYPDEFKTDAEKHWKETTCDGRHIVVSTTPEAHIDENNDGVCDTCEYQLCQHTYDETWSHDNENHWKAANCGHVTEPKDKGAHADEDNNGICDGCEWNYDHEHTYAEDWSRDAENHWKEVTCTHDIEVGFKAAHVDEDNNGICDGCEWDYDHTHTYDETDWAYDLNEHYYKATCGHDVRKSATAHTDENNDGFCEVCEKQFCEHEFSEDWTYDTVNHWHATICDHSGEIADEAAHADENNDGLCDVCKWNYDHEHTYAEEWSHDNENHWKEVTCTHDIEVGSKAAHADENNDGICDGCEWNYDHDHTYAEGWSHDNDYHWHDVTCSHTIDVSGKAAHADENNDGICDGCLWNYDHEHTYAEEYTIDLLYHWYAVTCGHDVEPKGKETHTDEEGNGFCSVCQKQFCTHPYSEDWTYDGKYHWHVVTCPHTEQPVADKAEHYDEGGDGFCDACGRSMTCEHTYDESEYCSDATHHWFAPTCGHDEEDTKDSRVEHTDADGNLKCDVCESGCHVGTDDGEIDEDDAIVTGEHVITQ